MTTEEEDTRHLPPVHRLSRLGRLGRLSRISRLGLALTVGLTAVLLPVVATSASAQPVSVGTGPVIASLSGDAPNTVVGASYSYSYTAKYLGHPTACVLAISDPAELPVGLRFNSKTCTWSGKATQAGTYSFSVSLPVAPIQIFDTIVVSKVSITGDAPNALDAIPYSFTYSTNSPKGCSSVVGALPPGLKFKPATCTLTGTPTKTGFYEFTVRTAGGSASDTDTIGVVLPGIG